MEHMYYDTHCSFDSPTCCVHSNAATDTHCHVDFYEFCIFTSGRHRNTYKNNETVLPSGNILFYKPGESHKVVPMDEKSEHYSFIVKDSFFEEHWRRFWQIKSYYGDIESLPVTICKELPMAQFMYLSQLANALAFTFLPETKPIAEHLLDSLLFAICNDIPSGTLIGIDFYVNDLIRCFDACRILDTEITEICASFPVSQRALSEHFKEITGCTMLEYRNKRKMEYAAHLLQKDNYSVTSVANELKITCQSYFIRQFKKQFGITPKQYQMLYRKKNT